MGEVRGKTGPSLPGRQLEGDGGQMRSQPPALTLSTSTTSFFRSFRLAFSSTFSFFSFRSCKRERGHLSLTTNDLHP